MPKTKDFKGFKFDPETADALHEVDSLLPKVTVRPTQGSYSTSVAASAGTHDGGGAGDLHGRTLGEDGELQVVWAMRLCGFACWEREPSQGNWVEHIHFVRIDCDDAAPIAKQQVKDYLHGKNGLAGHGPDDGPKVVKQTFSEHMKRAHTKLFLSHAKEAGEFDIENPKKPAARPNEMYALERALVREGLLRIDQLDGKWKQSSREALAKYRETGGGKGLSWEDAVKRLGKTHGFEVE